MKYAVKYTELTGNSEKLKNNITRLHVMQNCHRTIDYNLTMDYIRQL